jgi:hypothetical protein
MMDKQNVLVIQRIHEVKLNRVVAMMLDINQDICATAGQGYPTIMIFQLIVAKR